MEDEKSLVLIKPDGVAEKHIGDVISRLENKQIKIKALKIIYATDSQLNMHYTDLKDKPFFKGLISYMKEGPIVAMVVEGLNVVAYVRQLAGATDPLKASPGTIRADFAHSSQDGIIRNIVHASDSLSSAKREIKIWFPHYKLN